MDADSENVSGQIGGVSLASFLQMLEQERKTCTLVVSSGDQEGSLYFEEGTLVDASCDTEVGEDAVYTLLVWQNPMFRVTPEEDRLRRIFVPLAHLLLNAAQRYDEQQHEEDGEKIQGQSVEEKRGDAEKDLPQQRLVRAILKIPKVKHYYLVNRQGKIITQSSKNKKIGDFITYAIVSGIQIRKALNVKGPHNIRFMLDTGEILLILPGAGMIIGLLLHENASVADIISRLRLVLGRS